MRKFKSATLAMLLASCGFARADVLAVMPADALVAGKVSKLSATSGKIAALCSQLGVDAFQPALKDPLGSFKNLSHLSAGINDDGEFGIAYMDPKTADVGEDDSFLFVVPVSDYQAFLTNFVVTPGKEGHPDSIHPKDGGKDVFVAQWGEYAAVSPAEKLVAKPSDTLKVAESTTKEAAKQDLLVVANFTELSPRLMKQLDETADDAKKAIDKNIGKEIDAKYKPLIDVGFKQLVGVAKTFLNGTDNATFGVNISDQGINTTVLSSFKSDSYLGKLASKMQGTDKPLTIGLPAMRYLAFGGSTMDPAVTTQVFNDTFGPILAEVEKIDGLQDAQKLTTEVADVVKKNSGATFGMPVPQKIGEEGALQQITIYHGGGVEMKTLATDGGALTKQFFADLKLPPDRPKPTFEQTINDKSIEGVSFDSIKVDLPLDPNDPQAAIQTQVKAIMYGPEGLTYHYGTIGDDLIMSMGATDDTIGTFIKAYNAKDESVSKSDGVKAVAAQLPKMRVVEYYVALDEFVNVGVQTAGQFGFPVQVQLPPDLPPLGVTFGGDGTTLRFDSHLPTATVQALIAAGMQAVMGMRGGGGNL